MGKAGNRPSFILFVTDQQRADFLGCYGHPLVKTPHIDALAARGVAFDRFYVSSPVCMPNRASLMTGRLPSAHGVRANGIPLSRRNVTFVELLRHAGYRTALIGKSHLQNFSGKPPLMARPSARKGFCQPAGDLAEALRHGLGAATYRQEEPDFWSSPQPRVETPFYGFDDVDLVTGHGDGVGGDYVAWATRKEPGLARLIGARNQLGHDYACPQAVRTAVPPDLYSTSYIAERARAFLARQEGDAPFFLMVSFPDPHHPFNPPGRYWDMYAPGDMALPDAFARNDWAPPPHVAAALAEREAGTARLGGMGTIACTAREAREARALTCGMITMIDDAIGTVVDALEGSARGGDTVAIFTSDHGDHLGDHRLLLKGAEHYEQITRVPFIWADPQGQGGVRRGAIGQTHDIAPTLLERARIEPFVGMQGISLLPAVAGGAGRGAAFIQYDHQKDNPGIGPQPRVHTLRDARYRLSLIHGVSWGELYDLQADPGEFDNLWAAPEAAATKARLIEQLAREEIAAVDRAPFPLSLA